MNNCTFDTMSRANKVAIVQGANYIFIILTDRLIRGLSMDTTFDMTHDISWRHLLSEAAPKLLAT